MVITSYIFQILSTLFNKIIPIVFVANILTKIIENPNSTDLNEVGMLALFAALFVLLGKACEVLANILMCNYVSKGMQEITDETFDEMLHKSYSFYSDNFAGAIVNKISMLVSSFEGFSDQIYFHITPILAETVFFLILIYIKAPLLVFIFVILAALMLLSIGPIVKRRLKLVARRTVLKSNQTAVMSDAISNVMSIKAQSEEEYETDLLKSISSELHILRRKTWIMQDAGVKGIIGLLEAINFGVLIFVSLFVIKNWNVDSNLVFFIFAFFGTFVANVLQTTHVWRDLESNLSEGNEALLLLEMEDNVTDLPITNQTKIASQVTGKVTFKDVYFRYPGASNNLFNGLNLEIEEGEKIGLVGVSGGGKTSITKLLLRFFDPDTGQILIDNYDISKLSQSELRKNISFVAQENLLFHRSIMDNIRYGNFDASDEEVIEIAKKAHVHEFVKDLPDGYETFVGERGVKLSGGQRQRVSIARAMIRPSKILILDEATSALDSESEVLIQESLVELMKTRTSIVIAHRLSTISHLDRILVIENGEVVEEGKHSELLKANGSYSTLWEHQSGGFY